MIKKKACLISGGGAWGAYGGGTLARINGEYDTVVGVSTGSLLAPLAALRDWEVLKDAYTNVSNGDIFDSCWYKGKPITKNGRLRKLPIIITILLGQKSICTSDTLRKTIDKFFSKKYFDTLRQENKEIIVGTQNFAQLPSKIHYFSSFDEDYTEFKDWMWCSANFPLYTSLVKKGWRDENGNFHVGLWSDGALTGLIGLNHLSMKGYGEIDVILHRTRNITTFEGNKVENFMGNVTTGINAMRYHIEYEHFYEKIRRLNKQGTKVTVYWLPRKLSTNSMVFNQKQMTDWWNEGYETAFDPERIEIFEPTKKRF